MTDIDRPAKPATVWQAITDGFSIEEIMHMWAVRRDIAFRMMADATPRSVFDQAPVQP
jgi:hypothetical protein